jgi:WD40 repeat protein
VSEIPPSDWTWINAAADRFERAWNQGTRPRIEDYLAEVEESQRPALLEELLRVELELRRRAGEEPVPEDYTPRFPEQAERIEVILSPGPGPSTPSVPRHELPTVAPETTNGQAGNHGEPAVGARVRYFGDYEITREIARGGMGVVFEARQMSLNRPVALKMILAGQLADDTDVRRFRTEAEAAANLDHPGIVPIFEVGQHEGQHYFSMGFIEGQSLSERLTEGPLPVREAAALLVKVAEAIEYAHRRGVIHRDLKPANILLDANGNPRVTDFGLAKRVQGDSNLTGSGQIMGTPSYMPPEQAGGKRGDIGPAADVYALGATLYCMVTGRPPFQAATAMETVLQVIGEQPVAPRRLNASIPRDLETICLRCLEKEPGRRYGSAGALGEDLRRYLAGEPISARPVTGLERAVKWARRRPAIAGLLGLVALVAAVGLGGVLWQWREAVLARGFAEREWIRAEAQTELAERESERAKAQTELAEQRLYDVRMNVVQRNWEDYHGNLLLRGLDVQLPAKQGGVDRRGFEWFYWRRKTSSGQITLKGHPDDPLSFRTAALSRDGRRIIGGARDGAVKVWDAATGEPTLTLEGHTGRITSVAFSPDGRRLASACAQKNGPDEVTVWDAATGQEIITFVGRTTVISVMAFNPDGRRLATTGIDLAQGATVNVWDAETGQVIQPFEGAGDVTFSPDGRHLASCSLPPAFKLWDAVTGQVVREIKRPSFGMFPRRCGLVFSPDGRRLAATSGLSGLDARGVTVWDAATGQEIGVIMRHNSDVTSVAFSPDGLYLSSGTRDGAVKVWDTETGQGLRTLKGRTSAVLSLAFSPDGSRITSVCEDWTVRTSDVPTAQETLTIQAPARGARRLTFDLKNTQIASAGLDGTVRFWSLATGQEIRSLKGHTELGSSVAFSPDASHLASAGSDHTVKVWDVTAGRETVILSGHTQWVSNVAFSPDGRWLASASGDKTVKVWDAATGQVIRTLNPARNLYTPLGLAFSPDGQRLAASGSTGTLEVWDAATGRAVFTVTGHRGTTVSVAFSPDGQHLASASSDQMVKVWNAATGEAIRTLSGHTDIVTCVTFSPDGRRLASGGVDGEVKVWDATTGQETLTFEAHPGPVTSVVFSRDGHLLASSGQDGTIKVWDARPLDDEPAKSGARPQ